MVTATLDEPANEQIRFLAKVVPCEKNLCGSDAQATVDATTSSDFERRVYYNSVAERDANGNTSVDGKWGADGDNPIYWFYSTRYIIINEGQISGTASWETQADSDTTSESFLVSLESLSGPEPDYYLGWPHPDTPNLGQCGWATLTYCYKAAIRIEHVININSVSPGQSDVEGTSFTILANITPRLSQNTNVIYDISQTGDFIDTALSLVGQGSVSTGDIFLYTIHTDDDAVDEPDGSITFTLLPGTEYVLGDNISVTITVTDNDPTGMFSPPGDFLIGQVPEVEGEGQPEDPPQPKQLRQEQPQQQDSFTADQTLISNIKEYAAETWRGQEHVDRWHRVLKTLGAGDYPGLTTMTSEEAYTYVQQGWNRWVPVVAELKAFEAWQEQQQPPQPPAQDPPQQKPQQPPVNLVSNSSFEAPIVTAHNGQWQQFAPSTAGISWTVTGDSLEIQRGILGGASDGSQHAELDAQGSVTISQTLSTVSGQAYEISFDYKARPNTASNTNGMNVTWNGVDIAPNLTLGNTWQTYTVNVTGTGSDTISFADAGTSDGIGTFLDNVSVMRTGSPPQ